MGIVRNVFRRKTRAFLTIFGITIGVLALVVMGAMAEKLNLLVDGGIRYYGDKVTVVDAGTGSMCGAPDVARSRARDRGTSTASAAALGRDRHAHRQGAVRRESLGTPPMILATDHRRRRATSRSRSTSPKAASIRARRRGMAVVGRGHRRRSSTLRSARHVTLRGEKFEVVGIAEKTLTAPDKTVVLTMADAQELYAQDLPSAVRDNVDVSKLCTASWSTRRRRRPRELAKRVNSAVTGIKAAGRSAFKKQVVDGMKIFNSIIFGIALISLIVGGMSVINTMTMSVAERTREIGIRKAIGASTGAIVRQFVAESRAHRLRGRPARPGARRC